MSARLTAFLSIGIFLAVSAPGAGTASPTPAAKDERRAYECFDLMEYGAGIALADKILAADPKASGWRVRQAFAHFQLGKIDAAIAVLRKEADLFREAWLARAFAAALLCRQGGGEEAERAASEARGILLRLYPSQNEYSGPGFWPAAAYARGASKGWIKERPTSALIA